jgi:hypothetical protein
LVAFPLFTSAYSDQLIKDKTTTVTPNVDALTRLLLLTDLCTLFRCFKAFVSIIDFTTSVFWNSVPLVVPTT